MAKKKSSSRRSSRKKATRPSSRKKTKTTKKKASRSASASRSTSRKTTKKKARARTAKKKAPSTAGKKRPSKAAAAPAKASAKPAPSKSKRKKAPTGKSKNVNHKPADAAPDASAAAQPPTKPKLTLAPPATVGSNGSSSKSKANRPVKPPPSAVPVADREPPTESELRKVKTGLTRRDKDRYRRLLLQKRSEILNDVESLQTESRNSGGDLSHMPVHMADIGSDNYEQEFTLGLVESERKLLREIDDALQRLSRGTFGVCMQTGKPIAKARLDAKPWAKYCIEVVRELERLGKL